MEKRAKSKSAARRSKDGKQSERFKEAARELGVDRVVEQLGRQKPKAEAK